MKTLITGTGSGLGEHLSKIFPNPTCVTRMSRTPTINKDFDLIIHCACDPRHSFPTKELDDYWDSNFGLLADLLQLKSRYFVFLSSLDVAPFQDEITSSANPYVFTKLVQEMSLKSVKMRSGKYLILRPSMLIGPTMRPNSITKILSGEPVRVSGESEFNCISYDDVAAFIMTCHQQGVKGTFDLCSTENMKVQDLSPNYDRQWGEFLYKCPAGNPAKAYEILPRLNRTTREVIEEWRLSCKQKSASSSPRS